MNALTLKHLRYFEALARFGHFGRAAESLSISQPALSLQMKELESILGAPLIERTTRHIRLTPLGEAFAARARDILQSMDELGDLARAAQNPLLGRLRLGVIPTVAPYFLPKVMRLLQTTYPGLEVRPREAITQKLIEDLHGGQLDAAIVALPVSEPALTEYPLFEEDFVLVRPKADEALPVPNAEGLKEMRLLLLEEGHCFREQALSYCQLSSSLPRDLMEGSSLSTLVQMVGANIGVTLIPHMAVDVETRSAEVCIKTLPEPRPKRTIGLIWRKTNPISGALRELGGSLEALSPLPACATRAAPLI